MPSNLLNVPHIPQEFEYYVPPALAWSSHTTAWRGREACPPYNTHPLARQS
jgi:hypothetical protein